MTKLRAVLVLTFSLWWGQALLANPVVQPLVDALTLSQLVDLPQVKVVDIRAKEDYEKGHIPHALSAPYALWRGPANNPGQLIEKDTLQQRIRQLGLSAQDHVIVYAEGDSQTDFGAAARVYWTFKYAGLTQLSVLNGGYQQWQKQKLPISKDPVSAEPSDFVVQINDAIVISQQELLEKIQQPDASSQWLDARPESFFQGQTKAPTASVPGTIAGAKSVPHQQWFNTDSATLKPIEVIQKQVQQSGLAQAQDTVSFCNTGHWAATNWFVLSEIAQLPNVKLYPASLAEWTQSAQALPMEHTPNRLGQIRLKFQQLFNN